MIVRTAAAGLGEERGQGRGQLVDRAGAAVRRQEEVVAVRLALERGWLRLTLLEIDGRTAGAFYGLRYGQVFHFYQSGIDPSLSRWSIGLVMLGLTIKSAIDEGASEYDMLHGNESYKFLWATQHHPLIRIELHPPGPMGRVHRNAARITTAAKKLAKRVLYAASPSVVAPLE